MFGSDPIDSLTIPDGVTVEEHDIVTHRDILIGGQSSIDLGVRGKTIVAGERVRFGGDIEADGDCRLDVWCRVQGNVLVGENAYLGERVHVEGQLLVSGDLDIGDDVEIEQGFEANGWIVVRNPMPTIVFLFIYLTQLLRLGEEEAAEAVANELLDANEDQEPLTIPRGARVSDDAWQVSTPATIGSRCRLHGNIRATEISFGKKSELFGSLRGKDDITIGRDSIIHGDVTTREGDITITDGVEIRGDVACQNCKLSENANVDGAIRARGELTLMDPVIPWNDLEAAIIPVKDEIETEDTDPVPAIVPIGDGIHTWDAASKPSSHNGVSDDISELILDAEES